MEILKIIGKKIKARRKSVGLSQEKLGELTSLSTNYIGQIERGQRQVALDTLAKITEVLGTDLGTVFDDFRTKGNKTPADTEIASLTEAAQSLGIEDLKILRRTAERLAKDK